MWIQAILIIGVVLTFAYFLLHINTYSVRAWKKILLLLLVIFIVITIIFPNLTTDIAKEVGVGRGADLLLYGLAVAFIFVCINDYLKFQELRTQIHSLARKIALMEAEKKRK
jgi:hypothetical protein